MMLRNIFLKTVRDNRTGILAWGGGVGLLMVVSVSQYAQLIGTGSQRQQLAAEAAQAFQAFSFLIGDIVSLDTLGGFTTTRVLGFMPIIIGLWAAVAAAGVIRGEEQTGALDVLLSTPQSRQSVLAQKVGALGLGLVIITALMVAGLGIGSLIAGEPFALGDLALTMLNVMSIAAFWGALALLIGHFSMTRRAVSGITGGLIFGTYLLNNILGGIPGLEWLAWLMPFHYYSISKPLVPGRTMEWGAWVVLVAATGLLIAAAAVIFVRRDIGSVFRLFNRVSAQRKASGNTLLLGSVFGKCVRDLIVQSLLWGAGLALYGALLVATANQALAPLRDMLKNLAWLSQVVGNLATPESYLSFSLFIYLPVLLAVFAITQVISWAGDEEEGRLELPAGEPIPRVQLLLAQYVALALALLIIVAVTGAALLVSSAGAGVSLDNGRLLGSLAASILPAFAIAAFGLCAATWFKRPGTAVPLTIGLVVVMFFMEFLGTILKLPEAVLNISVFHLYGRPLTEGLKWGGLAALTVASFVLLAGSLVGFNRRDIAK